jgi:hypothetical protein
VPVAGDRRRLDEKRRPLGFGGCEPGSVAESTSEDRRKNEVLRINANRGGRKNPPALQIQSRLR